VKQYSLYFYRNKNSFNREGKSCIRECAFGWNWFCSSWACCAVVLHENVLSQRRKLLLDAWFVFYALFDQEHCRT